MTYKNNAQLIDNISIYLIFFNYTVKRERLNEVYRELEKLRQEQITLEKFLQLVKQLDKELLAGCELLELAQLEQDDETAQLVYKDFNSLYKQLFYCECFGLFTGKMDTQNAFLEILTRDDMKPDSEYWAQILFRMYSRWAEQHDFAVDISHYSPGKIAEVGGNVTLRIIGDNAYGWLRTETGRHRLVHKSPFEQKNRNSISFAEVYVIPEIDDDVDIEINPSDLRIDIYRSSRCGGAHVCRTDTDVRITHLPTNLVVQCDTERSCHRNKAKAMKHLRAKLYALKMQQGDASQSTESQSSQASYIRLYDFEKPLIQDLRTGIETTDIQAVLDGNIDNFIEASLKSCC